jgi:hypothetical protein
MKNIQGLKEVALFNPVTGDVVNLKLISSESTFNKEPITNETGTGAVLGGYSHTVECVFYDLSDRAQLETWENASTELNLVGLTSTGALLWYHPTPMSGFVDSLAVNARDGVSPYRFVLEAHGLLDIYYGMNVIRAAMKRNEDGVTQYNQTEDYLPKRVIPADAFPPDERYRIGAFGKYVPATLNESSFLRFPFPLKATVYVGMTSDVQFAVRTRNFAEVEVDASVFDADGATNAFLADGYWLEVDHIGDETFINLFLRVAGEGYTEE